jgi:pimeloyl-ACP methyl ester carboxylesterase
VAQTIQTLDGRTLELHDGGDPDGFPVVVHHGTPSSGLIYASWETPGVRLIGYDRAGYGGSARRPGRVVANAAADVDAIADALGLEAFATWGISGGGPHALACAALCSERLTAAASLAAVAPWDAEGEETLGPELGAGREHVLATTADQVVVLFETLLGAADRAVLSGAFGQWVVEGGNHGLQSSAAGWIDDDLAFVAGWGFDLAAIDRPVLILQGGDDRFVPRAHGEWLAARVPGNETRIDDADGHLTLIENRVPEVHDWLLRHS